MKVFLTSRAFLILSLLWLSNISVFGFFQDSPARVKTKYEFTDARISLADTLLKKRQYEEALDAYQKAYDIYESESFYEGMVYAKERMGHIYRRLKKDSLSRTSFDTGFQLADTGLSPNHMLISKLHLSNGIRLYREKVYDSAESSLENSMAIYKLSDVFDSAILKMIVDYKFYNFYYSKQSIDSVVKYLELRSDFMDSRDFTPAERLYLLNDYSFAFLQSGDFQRAMAYAIEAQKLGLENPGVPVTYYADALFNLSRSFYLQRDYGRALKIANQLIDYTLENAPEYIELLAFYNLKAASLSGAEQYDLAAIEFGKIISILDGKDGSEHDAFYLQTIMNLGVCYQLMGDYEKAEKYLFKSLDSEKELNESFGLRYVDKYKYIGQYYDSRSQYSKAIWYYDSALRSGISTYRSSMANFPSDSLLRPTYNVLNILRRKLLGFNSLKEGQSPDSSLILSKAALNYSEKIHRLIIENRSDLQASQGRLFLSEDFKDIYEAGIEAAYSLFQRGIDPQINFEKALWLSSQSKSILFLEQSGELAEVQNSRLPSELKNRFFNVKTRIDNLESIFFELIDDVVSSDSIREVNSELMLLHDSLKFLKRQVVGEETLDNNRDYGLLEPRALIDGIESFVNHYKNRAVIEYFMGEKNIYVFGLSETNYSFIKIELDDDFGKLFFSLMSEISKRPQVSHYEESLKSFQNSSGALYNLLLKDVLRGLGNDINQLTIIPDGVLSKLPFGVLTNDSSKSKVSFRNLSYLIRTYDINYSLSAHELETTGSDKLTDKGLLGIGYSGSGNSLEREGYGDLPGTEDEIEYLEKNMSGDFFLGDNGSKSVFLDIAGDYDILHLAIHGQADSTDRYKSSLFFNGEDGLMRTSDLYLAGLKARLAILSACESGTGEINKGEGTFSIARGFALVGVPSLVMSLWKVNDQVTPEIMVEMYKKFEAGEPINKALSLAKRDYLDNSDQYTSHPYYWSAFVSLGEEVENDRQNVFDIWIALLAALFLTGGIISFLRKRKGAKKLLP